MDFVINKQILDLSNTKVMGILNVSPDSFFDGGKYNTIGKAVDRSLNMIVEGASFIDVGGESTKPGAHAISSDEEASRVVPVVESIAKRFDIFISVNTSKALVIRESAAVGAHLINDVRSLSEPGAIDAVFDFDLSICLMHMQGTPDNMQKSPFYKDVVLEIKSYFLKQIARCESFGIKKNKLLLDPGFGFGKTLLHNYKLLSHLSDFYSLGVPLLVGMSHKSMICALMCTSPKEMVMGSVVCAVISALQGVKVLRVHDVKQTVEALRIVRYVLNSREKIYE